MILELLLFAIVAFIIKLSLLYYKAKPKHRHEWIELQWYFYEKYGGTGIAMPRAFISLFDFFEDKNIGFIFQGTRVVVLTDTDVLICTMDKSRWTGTDKYDIGAGGMVQANCTPLQTAVEELEEELGISSEIEYYKTMTPANNYCCILHIYIAKVNRDINLQSKDGTYEKMEWTGKKNWQMYASGLRGDALQFMKEFSHIL
jgi:hypothetical protein